MAMATRTAITLAIGLTGCGMLQGPEIQSTEDRLGAAGFRIKPADTPARQQALASMPSLKMMQRIKDGQVIFTYADPYRCKCLYVGNDANYQEYKRLGRDQQDAEDNLSAAIATEDTDMEWSLWGGPWW